MLLIYAQCSYAVCGCGIQRFSRKNTWVRVSHSESLRGGCFLTPRGPSAGCTVRTHPTVLYIAGCDDEVLLIFQEALCGFCQSISLTTVNYCAIKDNTASISYAPRICSTITCVLKFRSFLAKLSWELCLRKIPNRQYLLT